MSERFENSQWLTVLPASFIVIAIVLDLSAFFIPYPFKQSIRYLTAPFRNFLTLEDVMNPGEGEVRRSKAKPRVLSGLAFVASACWLGCFVRSLYLEDTEYAVKCLISTFTWVRVEMASPMV